MIQPRHWKLVHATARLLACGLLHVDRSTRLPGHDSITMKATSIAVALVAVAAPAAAFMPPVSLKQSG